MSAEPDQGQQDPLSVTRPTIPTIRGGSIHTLGRGNMGEINRRYPFVKANQDGGGANDYRNLKEDATAGITKEGLNDSSHELKSNEVNVDHGKNSFNALVSKFGGSNFKGGKKQASPNEDGLNTSTTGARPQCDVQESRIISSSINVTNETEPQPSYKTRTMVSFLKAHKHPLPPPGLMSGSNNGGGAQSRSTRSVFQSKKLPSFLKTKTSQADDALQLVNSPSAPSPNNLTNKSNVGGLRSEEQIQSTLLSIQTKARLGASSIHSRPRSQLPPAVESPNLNNVSANNSATSDKHHLVQTKCRQRLVLEQVAAQYFLRDRRISSRYLGVANYGSQDNEKLGNIDENADGLMASSGAYIAKQDKDAVISFLEGNIIRRKYNEHEPMEEDGTNLSTIKEASSTDSSSNRRTTSEFSQDIQNETNIDRILEVASDHLSLGKNDLALQAYRRAMKCAFADVLSVKQKLTEIKKRQTQGHLDPRASELTQQQEQQFGLSLLQVASRVADVHNNMGVVHEMNRHYEKARSSYVDALEVYHNTCKRFEERGDPDVDRTKRNVERMTLACDSQKQRKTLHEKASGIARRVENERRFSQRKKLLYEAIATLDKALELEGETIGLTHPVAAGTLIQIGKYHYEVREYDSAILEIRQAIGILRNALGGNHPQVGKSTLLLASIYERHGVDISPKGTSKDDLELELYVDALEPLKATLGEDHQEVGFLYIKIGHLYGKKGDLNLSLLAYKAALKAYGEPLASVTGISEIHPEVVSIWVRITEHLTTLKSWGEVLVAGRRALFLLRAKLENNTNCTVASGGASVVSEPPLPMFPSAERSSKKSHIRITSDTYYDSLFTTLQCLGQAHTSLSDFTLARDACSESLQLAWEMALFSASIKNEKLTKRITQVIRALKRLGKVYLLERHYNHALECFLPSLELLRSSEETESTMDCASVLGSLGFLYLKLKKFTEASNFLRECLRLYHMNGVSSSDRETQKIKAWLDMTESRDEEVVVTPPSFLEIPTIAFNDESNNFA